MSDESENTAVAEPAAATEKKKKPTKGESLEEIRELLGKIEKAEKAVQKAEIELDSRKEEAKTAKGVWMTRISELRDLVRTREKWAAEAKKQPLLKKQTEMLAGDNGESASESNGDTTTDSDKKAWRKWGVECLHSHGLPAGKIKILEENGLGTMGKLMDSLSKAENDSFWYRDLKGMGEGGYDAMVNAIMSLRKSSPDFQVDLQ